MSLSALYADKRVFVTGHTGFKGSWLSLWLAECGAKVYGYALAPPPERSLFEDAKVESVLAGHLIADVRDGERLQQALADIQPEIVFHLAAQPLVRLSYDEPVETYATNVMGTVNLLNAVRHTDSVRVCEVISSDKCYENREWLYTYRENDPMGGYDPYSNSKGCTELVVAAFRHSYFHPSRMTEHGVSLSSVRAGNVIGGGDWAADRIIPDCIRTLEKGMAIHVRNPHAIRPWQHVLEPLSGYLWLAAKQMQSPNEYNEGWNFGPSGAGNIPVAEVVKAVIDHWGGGKWVVDDPTINTVHEAKFLKLDITKARDVLDWNPVWKVEDAVRETVCWYKARIAGEELKQFSQQQIQQYIEAAQNTGVVWATLEHGNE